MKLAVIGLGYVGLPVATAFARAGVPTLGFDIDPLRIAGLKAGRDHTGETDPSDLAQESLEFTDDVAALSSANVFVVTVPTPIDSNRQPDLGPLRKASRIVGSALQPGALVVYESTVYPGVTEDFCAPILAEESGLRAHVDFDLGYSPERINPGDKQHRLSSVVKIVSGGSPAALERVTRLYEHVVHAGLHQASSIKVAEAAKLIENTQRDLNIALMNELAVILDRMNVRTRDVLDAAATKWNFLRFTPGLVGGHCIGVDPYYLTAKAESLGYHPEVILAGRRINDGMGRFIAQKLVKLLITNNIQTTSARVAILGLTFKENVPDIRNSKVPDIVTELHEFGIRADVVDPMADAAAVAEEFDLTLRPRGELRDLDAIVLATPHTEFVQHWVELEGLLRPRGVVIDVKSALPGVHRADITYWSL